MNQNHTFVYAMIVAFLTPSMRQTQITRIEYEKYQQDKSFNFWRITNDHN